MAYPYHSSHVRLYDVSNEQQWKWIGAVSLGRDPSDGMIRSIEIKDSMLYAVTAGFDKGIQFVDLNAVQGRFDQVLWATRLRLRGSRDVVLGLAPDGQAPAKTMVSMLV